MTHPRRAPGQSFDDHQREMAAWAGYGSVEAMNADHDPLHRALCGWLGITSHAMLEAAGKPYDAHLAGIEEDAVLAVQRAIATNGVGVPR